MNLTEMPFSFEGGQETVNAGFYFFIIVSAVSLYLAVTSNEPIWKGLNFIWFIAWTAIFISNSVHQMFIIFTFLAALLPLLLTKIGGR